MKPERRTFLDNVPNAQQPIRISEIGTHPKTPFLGFFAAFGSYVVDQPLASSNNTYAGTTLCILKSNTLTNTARGA